MQTVTKIFVIGIGYRPLTAAGVEALALAEVILASDRLLTVFTGYAEYAAYKDKILVINNVEETLDFLADRLARAEVRPAVLLASGDPLFFGIGRLALERFGAPQVEILPDLSSIQMAFARVKEPWDDALFLSLHGGPFPAKRRKLPWGPDDLPQLLTKNPKIAVLTDSVNNPAVIARALLGEEGVKIHVCQRLGYADAAVVSGTPAEIAAGTFAEPNLVILIKPPGAAAAFEIGFGLTEEELSHPGGLITKDEVRAVALHRLRLPARGILWDIGAGSGAVACEAARLFPALRVLAVERDEKQAEHIRENRRRFQLAGLELLVGEAPDALVSRPAPDRVFVGGSGGRMGEIIALVAEKKAPLVVVNAATLDTLEEAVGALEERQYRVEISQISVARARKIAGRRALAALNPVFVVTGRRVS